MAVKAGRLNLVDKSTLVYNLIVVLLLLCFSPRLPQWNRLILVNLGMIALVVFGIPRVTERSHVLLRFVRNLYPMAFFFAAYTQTERMNLVIFTEFLDPLFQHMEIRIFGFQPALAFAERFPQWWFGEYMYFAYFSYYLMFLSLGVILYFRRDLLPFREFMFTLCNTFYVHYIIFILLPVAGPRVFGESAAATRGLFPKLMTALMNRFELGGAAFPSSHVAVALLVMYFAFRYLPPKTFPVYGILGISLMTATVYCRYHYAIDVFAGILSGAGLTFFWRCVFLLKTQQAGGTGSGLLPEPAIQTVASPKSGGSGTPRA